MESLRIPIGIKEMLTKSKGKSLCRHIRVVASDLEAARTDLNEGRVPVGLGLSEFVDAERGMLHVVLIGTVSPSWQSFQK